MQKLESAIARADGRGIDVGQYKRNLKRAEELLDNNQLAVSLDMAQVTRNEIEVRLRGLENEPMVHGSGGTQ